MRRFLNDYLSYSDAKAINNICCRIKRPTAGYFDENIKETDVI